MTNTIAFFITITTYGTWLHGDERGSTEYFNGWQKPNQKLETETALKMSEHMKLLSPTQRQLVEQQVRETCEHRKWICHAVNCRTNHLHVVISAMDTPPKKVRDNLKAWCTRRLKEHATSVGSPSENNNKWWTARGSIRRVRDQEDLNQVIRYTLEEQDRKSEVKSSRRLSETCSGVK